MKQSIQLRLGQSLVMTPQLQQAIRLLQLSTAELNAEVQEALDSNMMLEMDEEQDLGRGTGTQNGDGEADRPASRPAICASAWPCSSSKANRADRGSQRPSS